MAAELVHRGPDGAGLYLDGSFGMVATRLAVVDLVGGDQPLSNEDGRLWVTQNGELYNHVELRLELEAAGHRFSTRCDTEVIVHAYEEWGPECLERLNGDFVFAVWDAARRELFLARDRFGVRPLFLLEHGRTLCFASEGKALLRHPLGRRELDPVALLEAFTAWSISPSRSAFAGIRELPPAHYLLAREDGTRVERRWWDLDFTGGDEAPPLPDAADALRELLDDATRIRLRADVTVAAYLSGGLDSSAVVALARSHVQRELVCFGLAFEDPSFDERRFQQELAAELGVTLHQAVVGTRDVGDLLPVAVALAERPTLRTALVPLLSLSGLVHDSGIKVVLTGEGADELFAGYDIFREDKIRRFWARDPSSSARPALLRRLYAFLPRTLNPRLAEGFFRQRLEETEHPLYSHLLRFANGARAARVLRPTPGGATVDDLVNELERATPPAFAQFTPLGRAQYLEIATFLTGYLLHAQGDRMLMGNSVEGRFPYLDHRVAEFAASLPDRYRLLGLTEKHILRHATTGLVPDSIRRRVKQPYRAPIGPALAGPSAPEYVEELLARSSLERAAIFEPAPVERLLEKARRHEGHNLTETEEMALVGVVSTMLLYDRFVAAPSRAGKIELQKIATAGEEVGAPA
jgi:asparagine synthase (glutamine-hydrolysing)